MVAEPNDEVLYVGGLEESVNEAGLHAAFIPFGEIKDVSIPQDHSQAARSGGEGGDGGPKHRGFGFVEFVETEDAAAAMDNMNDAELFGRTLKVNYAMPMKGSSRAVWETQADEYFSVDADANKAGAAPVEGEDGANEEEDGAPDS